MCLQNKQVSFGSRDALRRSSAGDSELELAAAAVHTANSAAAAMPLPHVLPAQPLLARTKSGDHHVMFNLVPYLNKLI
jgi:hypothetical protein